ncbi:MAG: HAD family hydrolase [Desulfitobacterium hafniense]|nr:HAD family hydrolase [Desulfitobacterium hafniense]
MESKYDVILFDLDGTLTNPFMGITKSVQYALKHFGIEENNLESLKKFIGPPLKESFQEYYHFDDIMATKAIEKYREYFSVTGIFENLVYFGIPELLEELDKWGKKLVVATSKPTVFAEKILMHFGLDNFICFTVGSNLDGSRVKKGEVISYALNYGGFRSNMKIVMVGDRKHDIIGAKENGIDSIGVLYGFGSRSELEFQGPTGIAEDVKSLKLMLLE